MNNRRLRPDFFVVGTARSGTTLARAVLTGHPDIVIPGETGFLPRLLRLRPLWWWRGRVRVSVFTRLAFANGRLSRSGLDRSGVARRLGGRRFDRPVDAISALYEEFARDRTSIIGDKTPIYIDALPMLSKAFPDARFIQMVRHPLDVIQSQKSQPFGPAHDLAAAWRWRRSQRRAGTAHLDADRLLVVRLEDLVESPEVIVEAMACHLGIDVDPAMMSFSLRADEIAQQNFHPESHSGLHGELRRTRYWQSDVAPDSAAEAWAIVEDTARGLGYDGPTATIKPRLIEARWRLRLFFIQRSWRRLKTLGRLVGR